MLIISKTVSLIKKIYRTKKNCNSVFYQMCSINIFVSSTISLLLSILVLAVNSKMAAKNHDGGRNFLYLLTKKFCMVLKNSHTKNGTCLHKRTAETTTLIFGCKFQDGRQKLLISRKP